MSFWPKVREELNLIVNRHFDTPEYHPVIFREAHTGAAENLGSALSALHQKPARLLGRGGGESAARRQARYLGT